MSKIANSKAVSRGNHPGSWTLKHSERLIMYYGEPYDLKQYPCRPWCSSIKAEIPVLRWLLPLGLPCDHCPVRQFRAEGITTNSDLDSNHVPAKQRPMSESATPHTRRAPRPDLDRSGQPSEDSARDNGRAPIALWNLKECWKAGSGRREAKVYIASAVSIISSSQTTSYSSTSALCRASCAAQGTLATRTFSMSD